MLATISMMAFTATAHAAPTASNPFSNLLNLNTNSQPLGITTKLPAQKIEVDKPAPVQPAPAPQPTVYMVVEGDTLTSIGDSHNVAWLRIWQKNTTIADPNLIHVGDQLTVPLDTEQLADRPLPAAAPIPQPALVKTATGAIVAPTAPRGPVSGNTYDYGYCTWYVKNRRPDLPNNLGNANTWYSRAAAQGYAVGSAPRPGAVGTTTRGALGHVVYVESINLNGTINISEMNSTAGWGNVDNRTADPSEFMYIY